MKLMTSVQHRCQLARLLQKQKQKQQAIAAARKTSLGFSVIMAKLYLAKVSSAYVVAVPVAGSEFLIVEGPQSKSFLPVKCPNSHSSAQIHDQHLETIPQTGSTELGGTTNSATLLPSDNSIVSSALLVPDENNQTGMPVFSVVKLSETLVRP